ncbi:MAG: nuclear transport factor 2 family protein [Gemmatimonadales bacterium]|jgi:ketosteroid isomerase-like protein|nr:MAG: nuclear transport factor 2 family protein [Gemmatimonadales bacterium]
MESTLIPVAELDAELNRMILEGNALEAFEKFYAEDVVMIDQGFEPWEGKDLNREREEDFFSKLTEVRAFELKETAAGDDVSFSIWNNDYTHAEWGEMEYVQVAVRRWRDGQIVEERFYRG